MAAFRSGASFTLNLPIKTLVIHAAQKAENKLSKRDFFNLAGRSGRASKETSGNVIFVETAKNARKIEEYLNFQEVENCISHLLQVAYKISEEGLTLDEA